MAFLLHDLRLAERREMLKDILEYAIPITLQDVVVIFCNVTGRQAGRFVQMQRRAQDLPPDDRRPDLERDPDHHGRRGLRGPGPARGRAAAADAASSSRSRSIWTHFLAQPLRPLLQRGRVPTRFSQIGQ